MSCSLRRAASLVLLLIGLTGVGTALYLWRENIHLRTEVASLRRGLGTRFERGRLRQGDQLPEFTARDTEGREIRVAERGIRRSLLFIYDPNCNRCLEAIPAWVKVRDKLELAGSSARVIGLSVADSYTTVQHARHAGMPFRVVPFPTAGLQRRYGVTEVPVTVVVDAQGVVEAVWDKPLGAGEIGDVIETVCPECMGQAMVARSSSLREGKGE